MILLGDCRQTLRGLPDGAVRCCVTSPPYWGLRDYGCDGQIGLEKTPELYVAEIVAVFREVRRVLADDGTLWLNIGDCYAGGGRGGDTGASGLQGTSTSQDESKRASFRRDRAPLPRGDRGAPKGLRPKDLLGMPWRVAFALQADGWILRSEIIWHKPNAMPESVSDRPTKAHEQIFLLAKSPRYFYDADAIKEESSKNTHARYAYRFGGKKNETLTAEESKGPGTRTRMIGLRAPGVTPKSHGLERGSRVKANASFHEAVGGLVEARNSRTVWSIPSQPTPDAHFATFPEALAERCILAGSAQGDTVLDPFFGSGTVGRVAESLGRGWIGCELSAEYVEIAKRKTAQIGLLTNDQGRLTASPKGAPE